jgi:hypothetical protein
VVGRRAAGLVGKRGIGSSFQLETQLNMLVDTDNRCTTRWTLRSQIAAGAAQVQPTLDAAEADLEDPNRVCTRHAGIERREEPFA